MNKNSHEHLIQDHHPTAIKRRLDGSPKQSLVSDAVLGGMDGCVTTFAIVSGAIGADFSPTVALVLGFANLVADGFSMAVSSYEAINAQQEFVESVRQEELDHIDKIPAGEEEEIRQIFERKGFSGETLETIVHTIISDKMLWVNTMLTEEHGLQIDNSSPLKPAAATFIAFVLVGAVPLIPFMFTSLQMQTQFTTSACLAGIMFFSIGSIKSLLVQKPVIVSGIKTLLTGSIAASLAFISGYVLRVVFGIGDM